MSSPALPAEVVKHAIRIRVRFHVNIESSQKHKRVSINTALFLYSGTININTISKFENQIITVFLEINKKYYKVGLMHVIM